MSDTLFDHIGIVVRNLDLARRFYSACLAPLGVELLQDNSGVGDGWLVYGTASDAPFLVIAAGRPSFWTNEHRAPSPSHVALVAPSRAAVDAFHAAGLDAGGVDNGEPGERPSTTPYYAAYLLDPDSNNIEAGCRRASSDQGD